MSKYGNAKVKIDENQGRYEEVIVEKKYSETAPGTKNSRVKVYLNHDEYNGFYTYTEILNFPECDLDYTKLNQRIGRIRSKMGCFYTVKEAIERSSNFYEKKVNKEKRAKVKQSAEEVLRKDIQFEENLKLFKIGSLWRDAKTMQSNPVRRNNV